VLAAGGDKFGNQTVNLAERKIKRLKSSVSLAIESKTGDIKFMADFMTISDFSLLV